VRVVAKSALKAKMLEYFRDVETTGDELVVTSNGVPVLRVVPITRKKMSAEEAFADVRGKIEYRGDMLSPTADEWPET